MIRISRLVCLLVIFASIISCAGKKKNSAINLSDVNKVTPNEIIRFDRIEDLYFSHLSYKSIAIGSKRTIIADREIKFIALIDNNGKPLKKIREGRGPGEILDVYEMTETSNNTIYFNDSGNQKILLYDENLNFIKEFKPKPYGGTAITNIYPGKEDQFIFELTSFDFLENKDKENEKMLIQYNLENEEYGKEITIKDRPYARTYLDGRLVGASQVPFSDIVLTSYNPENKSVFIYETSKSQMIEINTGFDTLNTVLLNLPREKLNDTEIDSLRGDERSEQWKTMSAYLPEFKSVAERFFYNNKQFWLQSNLRGDYQKWFVLNMEGQIIKIVNLPKDVMVTHVSNENIGVRINDVEFALFENQRLEIED